MSSVTFRQFSPTQAEYEAIVDVYKQVNPLDPGSVSTWQHWDKHRDPARMFMRHVAEQDGRIIGYAFSVRTDPAANKFRFGVYILPDWDTPALIDAFNTYALEWCLAHEPAGVITQSAENETAKNEWIRAQGFKEIMRYPRSGLDVAAFDPTPFADTITRLADEGIHILSLVEVMAADPNWQRRVYDLDVRLNQDVPRPTAFIPSPFETYVQREFEEPNFMPELWFVAWDGDDYVGLTALFKAGDNMDILETGLTGVDRAYRRRGLATALKCQAITAAQQLGAKLINTSNEEKNPMFLLNLKLGFKARPADIDWEKGVGGAGKTA